MTKEERFRKAVEKMNAEKERKKKDIRFNSKLLREYHNRWFWEQWVVRQEDKEGNLINKFENVFEAEKKTGIDKERIKACMKYRQKAAGGYVFRYEDPYEAMRWLDKYDERTYKD